VKGASFFSFHPFTAKSVCHPEQREGSDSIIRLRKNKNREGDFLFRAGVFRNSLFDERFSKK